MQTLYANDDVMNKKKLILWAKMIYLRGVSDVMDLIKALFGFEGAFKVK